MKTKLLILLVVASMLSVGCQRVIDQPSIVADGEQVIALSSGVAQARAANAGNRLKFEEGDQIGVISMFAHWDTKAPQWDSLCHFENAPAAFVSNSETAPVITNFGWGLTGEGGREWNRYYPSRTRGIYVYAYYPYEPLGDATNYVASNPAAATDAERQPKLNVTLVNGPIIGGGDDAVLKTQPDILHYAGVQMTPVSSADLLPELKFKHTLAQLAIRVKRPAGSSTCKFVRLTMKTAAKATLNLADGTYTLDAPLADSSNRQDAVYTITMADSCTRVIPEAIDPSCYLDILNSGRKDDFNYLMILPLTAADAQYGEITLSCDFGLGSTSDIRDFKIMTAGSMLDFKPGSLNTLTISVALHKIELTASIATWGDGNHMEFPAD